MSGGGTGLMSGGGLSMGSGGPGKSGRNGCSIMSDKPCKSEARNTSAFDFRLQIQTYTSSPIARISASALLCSTTPGRIR